MHHRDIVLFVLRRRDPEVMASDGSDRNGVSSPSRLNCPIEAADVSAN